MNISITFGGGRGRGKERNGVGTRDVKMFTPSIIRNPVYYLIIYLVSRITLSLIPVVQISLAHSLAQIQ